MIGGLKAAQIKPASNENEGFTPWGDKGAHLSFAASVVQNYYHFAVGELASISIQPCIITCRDLVFSNPNSCEKPSHNLLGERWIALNPPEVRIECAILVMTGHFVGYM